jgi:hypothetical protein
MLMFRPVGTKPLDKLLGLTGYAIKRPCGTLNAQRISYAATSHLESVMDNEKKPDVQKTEEPKKDIGEVVGDLIVGGVTVLAHSTAEAVVNRVRKAAAKTAPVKAVAKVVKKAKTSAAKSKAAKRKKKATKKSGTKSAGKKAGKKSAKRTKKKTSKRMKR